MGANCEIEIITAKLVPSKAILSFFDSLDIYATFNEHITVISNWEYENLQKLELQDDRIAKEIMSGNIVLWDGHTSGQKHLGVMFFRNEDNTYSTSIWFEQSIKSEFEITRKNDHILLQVEMSVSQVNIFSPYEIILIAAGIEMKFEYRNTVLETMQHSIGVSQWYIPEGTGKVLLSDPS